MPAAAGGCLDRHVVMTPTHKDLRFACLNQVVWNRHTSWRQREQNTRTSILVTAPRCRENPDINFKTWNSETAVYSATFWFHENLATADT